MKILVGITYMDEPIKFEIADMYNQYRANHKGKAPSKYWIINRDEVPEIKSFEEFKKKVTE